MLAGFFGETCRMLAERNWAVVVAVHPEYCPSAGFRAALGEGYVNQQIDLPRLTDARAVRQIFDERVRRRVRAEREEAALQAGAPSGEPRRVDAGDAFEEGFERILFERYEHAGNVRSMLTIAQQALQETVGRGETRISNDALRQAMLALI